MDWSIRRKPDSANASIAASPEGADTHGLAVKIAIGVSLVAIAVRQRRRMERPKKPKNPPKWQAHVDNSRTAST